ncbi:MAG: DNA repair protein RecO [Stenotrophomonas maltophilia]|uniref:DNA repair protein RecO n=1 Tax=Stenotrophomonas maltophilia TaxID=40324 RepID=A0A7V8FHS8_STEMA|nr:MAG: DNA repair protein RecO [Stenotrophomonas maltophilia]
MLIEDDTGYVLHARAYRETSLLVDVLSAHHGRLGVLARGVSTPKGQVLRAALQPLQWIRFSALQRGELAQLRGAEALDAAPRLAGAAMLAGFYLSELTLRLAPREDPLPELYLAYGEARARLAVGAGLAWTLRRFERELLAALGLGFDLDTASDGQPIDPAARYALDPEQGPQRMLSLRTGERQAAATGTALLALAADEEPEAADLASLRLPMRQVLSHHLGPRGLKSWDLLEQLSPRR